MTQRARACLLVLCGLPGAGKTTLSRALLRHASEAAGVQGHLVCVDEHVALACGGEGVIPGGSGDFTPQAWKAGREAALRAAAALLTQAQGSCGGSLPHQLVILDDTMHYRSMRHECYQLARDCGAAHVQLHVRCSVELAQQRNWGRPPSERIPPEVLARTAEMFEDPSGSSASACGGSSQHAWERGTLVVDVAATTATAAAVSEALWGRVWEAWGAAPSPLGDQQELAQQRLAAQQATMESLLHQLELACRRQLGQRLRQLAHLPAQQRAELAQRLNACKRELLAAARVAGAMGERLGPGEAAQSSDGGLHHTEPAEVLRGGGGLPRAADATPRDAVGDTEGCDVQSVQLMLAHWAQVFEVQCDAVVLQVVQRQTEGGHALEPG